MITKIDVDRIDWSAKDDEFVARVKAFAKALRAEGLGFVTEEEPWESRVCFSCVQGTWQKFVLLADRFGTQILSAHRVQAAVNRRRCVNCKNPWHQHEPHGGKCLFQSSRYEICLKP